MKKDHIYMLGFIWLVIDQFSKYMVSYNMRLGSSVELIPGFFRLHYIQNEGAAWGIFHGQVWFLTIISVIAVLVLNYYLKKERSFTKLQVVSFGLLLGGMLGNLIDRLLYQYVIDFLDFQIFGYDFPIFNIADIGVVVGVILLVIEVIRGEMHAYRCRSRKS